MLQIDIEGALVFLRVILFTRVSRSQNALCAIAQVMENDIPNSSSATVVEPYRLIDMYCTSLGLSAAISAAVRKSSEVYISQNGGRVPHGKQRAVVVAGIFMVRSTTTHRYMF